MRATVPAHRCSLGEQKTCKSNYAIKRIPLQVFVYKYNMRNDKSQLTPMKLRERVGLTQRQVSVALDKRQSTISDWERGITSPRLTLKEVQELMQLYNCTLDELVEAFEMVKPSEHPQLTE